MNGFPKTVRAGHLEVEGRHPARVTGFVGAPHIRPPLLVVVADAEHVAGDEAHGVWNASDVRSDDAHCLGESVHPAIVDLPRTPCSGGTPAGRAVRPRGPPACPRSTVCA